MLFLIFFLSISTVMPEDITSEIFSGSICCPAAFGHFNRDKLTDVFIINKQKDKHVASVLIAFESPPILRQLGPSCEFEKKIVSIVPADFDGDGDMDALVLVYDEVYKGYILWGNATSWKCPSQEYKPLLFSAQPILMDYNGDMIADLFGENEHHERVFWVFGINRNSPPKQIKMSMRGDQNMTKLSNAKAHSFADLDEDLAADLWLTTSQHFEFWSSAKEYKQHEIIVPPTSNPKNNAAYGQNIFGDFDLDGKLELLVPVCAEKEGCFFYLYEINGDKQWYNLQVNLTDPNHNQWKFQSTKSTFLYTNTMIPRVGDLNLDGYPDLLLTMFDTEGRPAVFFLENIACLHNCSYPRTFWPNWGMLREFGYSVMGTFFDFNEDGSLDILLVNTTADGQEYKMAAFKNPIEYDATFLKVIVLTGQCYYNCSVGVQPHGTNQPGPSVSYSIITATGDLQKSLSTQLSQSSHFSLQLPFTVFGLGRNWNFVERLSVGLPLHLESTKPNSSIEQLPETERIYKGSFSQIIPNSQVVVIPFPMWDSNKWIHKLFITPSKAMILTACSLIIICIVVASMIVGLHYFERREDQKERLQEAQRFHFVAM